ncbi:MAG: hypothetical protein QRY71_00795 [Candidatus Rhabdochlamydia sp.]
MTSVSFRSNQYWNNCINQLGSYAEQTLQNLSPAKTISSSSSSLFPSTTPSSPPPSFVALVKQKLGISHDQIQASLNNINQYAEALNALHTIDDLNSDTRRNIAQILTNVFNAQLTQFHQISRRIRITQWTLLGSSYLIFAKHFAPLHANKLGKPFMILTSLLLLMTKVYHSYQNKILYQEYEQIILQAQTLLSGEPLICEKKPEEIIPEEPSSPPKNPSCTTTPLKVIWVDDTDSSSTHENTNTLE